MAYTTYKRPGILTALCIIGYIVVMGSLPSIFSPDVRRLGIWFPSVLGLLIALRFIAFVGIWHMKKWGVELLLYAFLGGLIITELAGITSYFVGIPAQIIALGVAFIYYRKMDRNL